VNGALVALAAAGGLGIAGAGWWLRRRYLAVTVDGRSMLPTYRPGERLLVRRIGPREVRTGQVVVLSAFGAPKPSRGLRPDGAASSWILKRVAAVPGDPIPRDTVAALRTAAGTRVPADHLVVLGDNPAQSRDSRQAGYFTADRLLGTVVRRMGAAR
jgi:signal peptidase I